MTVYLGALGRMVELYTTPSATVVAEERYSFTTTLEGRRKAQVRPVGRRTWTWSAGFADASEQGAVMSFANGEWGNGPFVFVPADAPLTNLLSPEQASCDPSEINTSGVTAAGPLLTADGWAGRSYFNPSPAVNLAFGGGQSPVLPGRPLTASAYLVGAGSKVGVSFWDSAGLFISSSLSTASGVAGAVTRLWATATPPANAVGARVFATNASQGARPALTWTDKLVSWADGQGCTKAVVHAASRALEHSGHNGTFSNISFTVTEVG